MQFNRTLLTMLGASVSLSVSTARANPCVTSLQLTVETSNEVNSGPNPLVGTILSMGSPIVKAASKAEIILRGSDIINRLGLTEWVAPLRALEDRLIDLGRQVLRRGPVGLEEKALLEGRGLYQPIRIGGVKHYVYTKGTGNAQALNSGIFPTFPNDSRSSRLFFDQVGLSASHPRIVGTETVTWGALELINAAIIFKWAVENGKFQTLQEALRTGVTIPLFVHRFPELTQFLNAQIDIAIAQTDNDFKRRSMNYSGNRQGIGTVQLLVPGRDRLIKTEVAANPTETVTQLKSLWNNPLAVRQIATTLSRLLAAGFVYSGASSHAQNLYREGWLGQADNSDLLFLGNLPIRNGSNKSDQATGDDLGALAIALNIQASRLQFPPLLPHPETFSWQDIQKIQSQFWRTYLSDLVPDLRHRQALASLIPRLLVAYPGAAYLALGRWLFAMAKAKYGPQWALTGQMQREAFRSLSAFGVEEEYNKKVYQNIPSYYVYGAQQVLEHTPYDLVSDSLRNGDESALHTDPLLSHLLTWMDAMSTLPESTVQSKIFQTFGELVGRELHMLDVSRISVFEMFEFRHFGVLQSLLNHERYEDILAVLRVLLIFDSGYTGSSYIFGKRFLPARIGFAAALLEPNADFAQILSLAEYQAIAAHAAGSTNGGLGSLLTSVGTRREPKRIQVPGGDSPYLESENMTFALLGRLATSSDRDLILDWLKRFLPRSLNGDTSHQELESLSQEPIFRSRLELQLLYYSTLYNQMFQSEIDHTDESEAVFQKTQTLLDPKNPNGIMARLRVEGFQSFGELVDRFPHHNWSNPSSDQQNALADEFENLQLRKVSRFFRLRADGEWFEGDKK